VSYMISEGLLQASSQPPPFITVWKVLTNNR